MLELEWATLKCPTFALENRLVFGSFFWGSISKCHIENSELLMSSSHLRFQYPSKKNICLKYAPTPLQVNWLSSSPPPPNMNPSCYLKNLPSKSSLLLVELEKNASIAKAGLQPENSRNSYDKQYESPPPKGRQKSLPPEIRGKKVKIK